MSADKERASRKQFDPLVEERAKLVRERDEALATSGFDTGDARRAAIVDQHQKGIDAMDVRIRERRRQEDLAKENK